MKIVSFLSFILIPIICFSQKQTYQSKSHNDIIKKWTSAVINIDCETSSYNNSQIAQLLNDTNYIKNHFLDEFQAKFILEGVTHTITGTAILLVDKGKKYLLTAKHMILDTTATNSFFRQYKVYKPILNKSIKGVCTLGYYVKGGTSDFDIPITINADNDSISNAIFDRDNDVAVISLQSWLTKSMLKYFDENKIVGIDISSLDTLGNSEVGDDIFAVGFPAISRGSEHVIDSWYETYSVPIVTFGKIAMFSTAVNNFFGDITIYPGNSGGPVVSNNKLIGIVSQQMQLLLETSIQNDTIITIFNHTYSRALIGVFNKAKNLLPLIRILEKREETQVYHKWND